jgi:hypothetical protein
MQRFIDRFAKAQLEDYLYLPMTSVGNTGTTPCPPPPSLLSLSPSDVRPNPLPSATRDFVEQRLEDSLFAQCYGLLKQLEGSEAMNVGRMPSLREK